jgi:hypothetical protein
MNPLQKQLMKFGRRYSGRDGFTLSRPGSRDDFTEDGTVARVEAEKLPLGTEVQARELEPIPTQEEMPGKGLPRGKASLLRNEIVRREGKDFSRGGADYDNDHNWKDAMRSAGLSALQALASANPNEDLGTMLGRGLGGAIGGGVGGAFDRNADEKTGNQIALDNLYPQWAREFKRESEEENQQLGSDLKLAQIETIKEDDNRMRRNLERQEAKDSAQVKRWEAMTDRDRLKLLGDDELREMRNAWALAKDDNEKRRLAAVEKEMENRMTRADADRSSREKIAGMRETGANNRAALQTQARQALAEYNAAVKAGQQDKAIAARERLAQLKAQADQTPQ